MTSMDQLQVQDVCDVYRLIGECRELGHDPALWQSRLLEGTRRLFEADFAVGGEGRVVGQEIEIASAYDLGFDAPGRAALAVFLREVGPKGCPIFQALRGRSGLQHTHTRTQLVPDRAWYASRSFECRRAGRTDHSLTSLYRTSSSGALHAATLSRELGRPDFSPRQQQLMSFLHGELGPLVGRALASFLEPSADGLSPRLRQTLACLLEGDSEKQVASRLRLSVATAHQYVAALYRHFGVRSRAQLLAHAIRRLKRGVPFP